MSRLTRLWQDDALHAELESIMKKHLSLLKKFSTASNEHRVEIKKEIEQLRQQREQLLNQ